MALSDIKTAIGLITQAAIGIRTLLSNWELASQEWESIDLQIKALQEKHEMWQDLFSKFGMMSDNRILRTLQEAQTLLQAEEAKLKGRPPDSKCCLLFNCFLFNCFLSKTTMLPASLRQTLTTVSEKFDMITRRLEEEQRAATLVEEKAKRMRIPPVVHKDDRYVRVATTEDSILKSLEDPIGNAITLLHGGSGAGKSTLARAVARHYVDRIGSNDTGFKFDHVALLEFGRDVQPGVQKQRLELIRSLGGKLPSGGEEESPDIDHQLETLLKDSAVLVILDDVWDAEPLEAFMKSRGEKVRYLVTTQIVDLWGCNSTKVKMEIMSLADARKLLAARIGYDGQEIPRNSLVWTSFHIFRFKSATLVRMLEYDPARYMFESMFME